MTIRCFVALPIDESMSSVLGDVAAEMAYQDKCNAVRWVDERNYHITLAFLGELDYQQIDHLADSLYDSLNDVRAADDLLLEVTHLSPFPESKPKHIAAMVKKTEQLAALQERVMRVIRNIGLDTDKRRFYPHITLGRYRHSRGRMAGLIPQLLETHTMVDSLIVFESILTPEGAIYEPLHELALTDHFLPLAVSDFD